MIKANLLLLAFLLVLAFPFQNTAQAEIPTPDVPVHTFVSAPDLFNADVGDVTLTRAGRGWEPGDPNSWNADYASAVDTVFNKIASYNPDSVFIAGDTVEGHWGVDVDNTGIFGPVGTTDEKLKAVTAAGNHYYGRLRTFFSNVGISPDIVYPAVGDHEIGDNPWNVGGFKYNAFETFKAVWARNFTTNFGATPRFPTRPVGTNFADTSYATWLTPDLLLVSVDVFRKSDTGITAQVLNNHLVWFNSVIDSATISDTVIVQGHTPALGPVRTAGSSALFLNNGPENTFWKTMNESGKVDFYFAGEVHAQTARQAGSTVQVTHGGLFAYGGTNYIVGNVYEDGRVELKSYNFENASDKTFELWQTSAKRQPRNLNYGEAVNTGSLTLDAGIVTESSGDLALNPDLTGDPGAASP